MSTHTHVHVVHVAVLTDQYIQ